MDVTGASGNYFRANVWSWRPIHSLCMELNQEQNLGLDLEGWGYNDGCGLHSQADCIKLATAIEDRLSKGTKKFVVLFADSPIRVAPDGTLGKEGESPYQTEASHLQEFVKFLRECGDGFEIW